MCLLEDIHMTFLFNTCAEREYKLSFSMSQSDKRFAALHHEGLLAAADIIFYPGQAKMAKSTV